MERMLFVTLNLTDGILLLTMETKSSIFDFLITYFDVSIIVKYMSSFPSIRSIRWYGEYHLRCLTCN